MVLVSEDVLNKLRNASDKVHTSKLEEAPTLDIEIKRILEKNGITESEKLTLYNQTLQRHLKSHKIENKPDEGKSHTDIHKNWISEIVNGIPSSYANDAISLYNWIFRIKNLTWSDTGELEIDGHVISGSNVVDLIYDAVRKNNSPTNPIGHEIFYRIIQKHNTPKKLIKNPSRVKLINSIASTRITSAQGSWVYV